MLSSVCRSGVPVCVSRFSATDTRMSLPSPADMSNIDIEDAHTPVPRGGGGGSPTDEVVARSPRRAHSGRCFVTLKRKGSSDIVRQAHARSASVGSAASGGAGGTTPKESFADVAFNDSDRPMCAAAPSPPFGRVDSARSNSGEGSRRGSWGGNVSTIASLEDAAQRIAVDPDSGHSYFVERPTVCDACPYCDDVCEVAWCHGCDERRSQLKDAYGPLMLSSSEIAASGSNAAADGGDRIRRSTSSSGGKPPPVLSRRYPRKSSYTLCEVRRRKLTGACWVMSQGSVYDVTEALADHPGGKRSVLRNAGGRDCVEDFFFHSKAAKKEWRKYRIGSLAACAGNGDGERSLRTGSDCVIC